MFTTRPELTGDFGMVASTHWLASATGMSVLERGGNASTPRSPPASSSRSSSRTSTARAVRSRSCSGPRPTGARVGLRPGRRPGRGDRAALHRARPRPRARHGPAARRGARGVRRVDAAAGALGHLVRGGRPGTGHPLRREAAFPLLERVADTRSARSRDMFRDALADVGRGLAARRAACPPRAADLTNPVLAAHVPAAASRRPRRRAVREAPDRRRARRAGTAGFVAEAIGDVLRGHRGHGLLRPRPLRAADRRRPRAAGSATVEEPRHLRLPRPHRAARPGPWGQGPVFLQQLALLDGYDLGADGPRLRRLGAHRHRGRQTRLRRPRGLVRRPATWPTCPSTAC